MRDFKTSFAAAIAVAVCAIGAAAQAQTPQACLLSPNLVNRVQQQLHAVVKSGNGGIFTPNRMWSAVVDRKGTLCSVISIGDAWPGSRAIAIAKAETANDFSNSGLALSTANLYAATQPGGSLYGLNNSNPFNPAFLADNSGIGFVAGGIITFGGGVALYNSAKQVIGGLGVSGDTSCADHAIAYRMRKAVGLDTIPGGVGLGGTDNIIFTPVGSTPSGYEQPHCLPTDVTP